MLRRHDEALRGMTYLYQTKTITIAPAGSGGVAL